MRNLLIKENLSELQKIDEMKDFITRIASSYKTYHVYTSDSSNWGYIKFNGNTRVEFKEGKMKLWGFSLTKCPDARRFESDTGSYEGMVECTDLAHLANLLAQYEKIYPLR